jgi:transglutaminase-like putative cysteine protease
MSRAFVLRSFTIESGPIASPARVSGYVEGDTSIAYVTETKDVKADTQHVRVHGPVLMPTLLPLAAMLGAKPKVGRTVTYTTFDPATMSARDVTVAFSAESLFTVADSAVMNPATGRWQVELRDTVRAWRLTSADWAQSGAWVDTQGRVVEGSAPTGLRLHRTAYELAFENWRLDAADTVKGPAAKPAMKLDAEVHTSTILEAKVRAPARELSRMQVRLTGPAVKSRSLGAGRQALAGDVVTVTRETDAQLVPSYTLPPSAAHRTKYQAELQNEPGVEVDAPVINAQAVRIVGHSRTDPRAVVEGLLRWVHDSLTPTPDKAAHGAIDALQMRRADCDGYTRLFTAMARKMGVPTRTSMGLMFANGKFFNHTWAEVYLGDWVAVDPMLGQFPADAAHLRLFSGPLTLIEKTLNTLHIEVLDTQ